MLPQQKLNFSFRDGHCARFLRPRQRRETPVQTERVRILLPPSEAKRPGGEGPPIDFGVDALGVARRKAAMALERFAAKPGAAAALSLPARSAVEELAADRSVSTSATMTALLRYSGIVYDGLLAPTLTAAARRRADDSILIFSGLWGVVRAGEPVPNYRLPASAALPKLGVMASYWRPVLDRVVPGLLGDGLVVDLRSTEYAAMWRPGPDLRDRVVAVRILSSRPGAPPAVISYPSKLGKGQLARALVSRGSAITRASELIDVWRASGGADGEVHARGVDLII